MALAPATLVPAVDALERHGLVTHAAVIPATAAARRCLLTTQAIDILARRCPP